MHEIEVPKHSSDNILLFRSGTRRPAMITATPAASSATIEADAPIAHLAYEPLALGTGQPSRVLRTVRQLLRDILTGVYAPGDRIREVEVAARLGVSRAPVREALRTLEQDGLVELSPGRGARVISFEPEQLTDLFDLLGTINGAVARFAVRHASDSELERVYNDIARYAQWVDEDRGFPALVDLGYQIGTDLGACCGNPMAAAMQRRLGRLAYIPHRYLERMPRRLQLQVVTRFRRLEAGLRARSEIRAERAARKLVQLVLIHIVLHAKNEALPMAATPGKGPAAKHGSTSP